MAQLDTASLTWVIEDFSNVHSVVVSSYFHTKHIAHSMKFFPGENRIGIFFRRLCNNDVKVLWTISLINDKGEECYPKAFESNYTLEKYVALIDRGWYHLDQNSILNPSSGLLPGGKLTVKCTVITMIVLEYQNIFAEMWIEDKEEKKVFTDLNKIIAQDKKLNLVQKKAFENYQALLESSKFSDVVFVIGKKEFKLHKTIIASQSPVFSAMFEHDMSEAKQNRVCITDVDVEVFCAMIRFIYTANVDSVQQYALDLFVAADKYQLDSLKDICAQSLGANLSIESVVNILLVADMHNETELKSKCIEFINNKNTTKVFASDGWKHLVKDRPELAHELYYDLATKFEKN